MTARLRFAQPSEPFHIVLVHPEIPQNTGNIARLAAATGSVLHLVGKLGFRTDEKAVRRAGLDYWHLVDVRQHRTLEDCCESVGLSRSIFLFTTRAQRSCFDTSIAAGSLLVFGSESKGLPDEILAHYSQSWIGIPTVQGTVRSLNLSNAVSAALYEALRGSGAICASRLAP
ncbi:MAG: tRNA (cytidine(34)-2'-O)-methyltransferase [Myxococcota bacterium]|jgi:tRNA (cytidine/uridine-2'-O-)-methyltransferase|nr:tRNA (cytidine(34)-2'-O)-methyltransferase [Myxococcota bacterium]